MSKTDFQGQPLKFFMSQLEIRHLRTLVALRETGSLVEASERVCLTQSALSHQIKELENRLGCSLFLRKTKPVRFTSAGNRLLELADEVLPRLHSAEIDLQRVANFRVDDRLAALAVWGLLCRCLERLRLRLGKQRARALRVGRGGRVVQGVTALDGMARVGEHVRSRLARGGS